MKFERPKSKVRRVVVIFRDVDGVLPSKATTVYETTPERAMRDFKRVMSEGAVSAAGGDVRQGEASTSAA
jgi:hypothetical protein